jgi:hypothetical protein
MLLAHLKALNDAPSLLHKFLTSSQGGGIQEVDRRDVNRRPMSLQLLFEVHACVL